MALSNSIGSHFPLETSGSDDEGVKISGTKRPIQSPPKCNDGNGHLVYVRRKPESELTKNNVSDAQTNTANCPDTKKSVSQDEANPPLTGKNEPVTCVSDVAPLHRASSPSFSSTRRSVSPSLGVSGNISSPEKITHGVASFIIPSQEDPEMDTEIASVAPREDKYDRLQSLLKILDRSNQNEYVQMLRSLSSVELSRHAVELEKRSIKLSFEEAKEMQRVQFVNVLGKYGKYASGPLMNEHNYTSEGFLM